MKLLTEVNPKTIKGVAEGFFTVILHLAPAKLSGVNVCRAASPACIRGCLNTSGHGFFDTVKDARFERTDFMNKFPDAFKFQLVSEIGKAIKKAKKLGLQLAVRINGTSDLPELAVEMADTFPSVIFYDYTSVVDSLIDELPKNYHITFSRKENNEQAVKMAIKLGFNVSVLFASMAKDSKKDNHTRTVPKTYLGLPVIDGDVNDLRFLDPKNCIVGLSPKGNKIKNDKSGFVVR